MNMDYKEGCQYMVNLTNQLTSTDKKTFTIGELSITYPGYKNDGDYKLTIDGLAPRHEDIVKEIYNYTTSKNFNNVVNFLEDVYENGTNATIRDILPNYKNKLFWITLQEEINYPQPRYKGRKLPFQRFYEAALVHKEIINLNDVNDRTNNHGNRIPRLLKLTDIKVPSFYTWK